MLCITGNIMSHLIGRGRGQQHELPDQLTLLRGLTKWAEQNNLWTEDKVREYKRITSEMKAVYRKNFVENNNYYANNPLREKVAGTPRFRFSFCDNTVSHVSTDTLTWTEKNAQGYYLCPKCRDKILPEMGEKDKKYILNSVIMIPLYMDSDMFTSAEIEEFLKSGIERFAFNGAVSSSIEGTRSLGYDYGLMLYNMVKLNNPLKERLLDKTLEIVDDAGAWVEYYDNDIPSGCRCRPWESAMNVEAIINYFNLAVLSKGRNSVPSQEGRQ